MTTRRQIIKIGIVSGMAALGASFMLTGHRRDENVSEAHAETDRPDGSSPQVTPYSVPLNRIPVKQPFAGHLMPPPNPQFHQRYDEFPPRKFYVEELREMRWRYHTEPPYDAGTWSYGFDGITPGSTYHARYGEPVLIRRYNRLSQRAQKRISFALPSATVHLHNGHTASESDGLPWQYSNAGEYRDYHYGNFPAGFDDREKLSTLWYHDHREGFTAANVYAGLAGFYLLFDELDSGDENDPNPLAWRLPGGAYDIPLILHDLRFDRQGQLVFDTNPNGVLGDRFTVNRTIQPYLDVEPRKYRFRILNGGPSRIYRLFLQDETPFVVLSNDGNMLPRPLLQQSLTISGGQRYDVIIDFSKYASGQSVILENRLEQFDGAGPTGRELPPGEGDGIMRFNVKQLLARDNSRIPDRLRELPPVDLNLVKRERHWVFDFTGGMWTINGHKFDMHGTAAAIEQGSAEIWTLRNAAIRWSHPVHIHFEDFRVLEKNGRKIAENDILHSRKDVMTLGPGDEVKIYLRWRDFLGQHIMHCHNGVHEDHAMMLRWDIVPPGEGF
jgi:FtsP/CotA-like multicopper oxidase with cupredoxin domain